MQRHASARLLHHVLRLGITLAALSGTACLQGERFNPRVSEIDGNNGAADIDFDYSEDGLLTEVEFGNVDISFSLSGGNIVAYEQGTSLTTVGWESGRVSRLFRSDARGAFETHYTYEGSALIHVERTQSEDGQRVYAAETTLRYLPDGPLEAVTHAYDTDGDGELEPFAETHTYRYDTDGQLDRVQRSNTEGVQNDVRLRHGDGVLEAIGSWDLRYDDQGRIGALQSGGSIVYDVHYESGPGAQVVVEPLVLPFAPFIDWSGKTFSAPDPRSLSLILDLARPDSL